MTAEEMWQEFRVLNPDVTDPMDAWAFDVDPDELAQLVLKGEKTTTASGYALYQIDNEPLPEANVYDVILDSQDRAVCVIKTHSVSVCPFKDISAEFAFKEGEGDKSLSYWRKAHWDFFAPYYERAGLTFNEESLIVCEEFEVVYPLKSAVA